MNKKIFGIMLGLILMASLSQAAVYDPCTGAGVGNVATLVGVGSGNTVVCGSFTFSNFAVSVSGGGSATIGIAGVGFSGFNNGVASLYFQIGSIVPVVSDILLFYQVTGPLVAVDLNNHGTNVTIQEQVFDTCAQPLYSGGCSDLLTTLVVAGSTGNQISPSFATVDGTAFIKKDIQFAGTNSFISDFQNSHHVPEPMTLSLMGVGLLGLGLMRKRIGRIG